MSTGFSANMSFIRRAFQAKRRPTKLSKPHNRTWRDYALILVPYLWMILFFLLPFLIIFKYLCRYRKLPFLLIHLW